MLAFTSVYFSESGLFNGLRPIQIKKNCSSAPARAAGCGPKFRIATAPRLAPIYRRAKKILSIEINSGYFRFCQINSRLPSIHSSRPGAGPSCPGWRGRRRAKDPNASEFRSEYDGISRTCMAFQSKTRVSPRPRAKDFGSSRHEHSACMRCCSRVKKTQSGLPVSTRSGRTARFT